MGLCKFGIRARQSCVIFLVSTPPYYKTYRKRCSKSYTPITIQIAHPPLYIYISHSNILLMQSHQSVIFFPFFGFPRLPLGRFEGMTWELQTGKKNNIYIILLNLNCKRGRRRSKKISVCISTVFTWSDITFCSAAESLAPLTQLN